MFDNRLTPCTNEVYALSCPSDCKTYDHDHNHQGHCAEFGQDRWRHRLEYTCHLTATLAATPVHCAVCNRFLQTFYLSLPHVPSPPPSTPFQRSPGPVTVRAYPPTKKKNSWYYLLQPRHYDSLMGTFQKKNCAVEDGRFLWICR